MLKYLGKWIEIINYSDAMNFLNVQLAIYEKDGVLSTGKQEIKGFIFGGIYFDEKQLFLNKMEIQKYS